MLIPMDRLVTEHGTRPKTVIHVGAHLGEEAPDYADAGVEQVLWIEANPGLMDGLRANVSQYKGQRALQAVCSDVDDQDVELRVASFSMSSSILPMKRHLAFYPTIVEIGRIPLASITVDTLLAANGIVPEFDMINIDVEGAELYVLRGMASVLPSAQWVYLEVNHEEMYEDCALVPDVDVYLGERGFERVAIEDAYLGGRMMGFADALYQRVTS